MRRRQRRTNNPRVRQSKTTLIAESWRVCLESRPEILGAYLFGSTARGDAQSHSDVDVAVFVDASRLRDKQYGYAAALTADLMTALRCTTSRS